MTAAPLLVRHLGIDPIAKAQSDSSPYGATGAGTTQRSLNRGDGHFLLLLVYRVQYVPDGNTDAKQQSIAQIIV
jgi:hypothetical protein